MFNLHYRGSPMQSSHSHPTGGFSTRAQAECGLIARAKWAGSPRSEYTIVEVPDQELGGQTNPKKALGDSKAPVHLVPPILVLETSQALGEGGEKYGPFNWRSKPVDAQTYIGAIGRHLAAYADGEDTDPESTWNKSHLAGIAACVAILMDAGAHGTLVDNRVKGPAPGRVRALTKKSGTKGTK